MWLRLCLVKSGDVLKVFGQVEHWNDFSPVWLCLCLVKCEDVLKALSSNAGKPSKIKQKLVDIGSGDGRIVFASAKAGYLAHGIELNIWLVLYSRLRALFTNGIKGSATFSKQDLWKSNLSEYQKVVIFGVEEMMPDLEKKLSLECFENLKIWHIINGNEEQNNANHNF